MQTEEKNDWKRSINTRETGKVRYLTKQINLSLKTLPRFLNVVLGPVPETKADPYCSSTRWPAFCTMKHSGDELGLRIHLTSLTLG